MLSLPPSVRIWIASTPVDLRKGFNGLAAVVEGEWRRDLYTGHLFVFIGKSGQGCKVLFWDTGGLVVYYERLEKGRFRMVRSAGDSHVELDGTALAMLLDGIDMSRVLRPTPWSPPKRTT